MTDDNKPRPETEGPEADAADAVAEDAEAEAQEGEARESEAADLRDQLLRALAETENVRRRAAKEKDEAGKYAITAFARDMLNVADNLRRALESVPEERREDTETMKTLVTGIELTERELAGAFERHRIRRIDALGQPFDYNLHQAMFEVEDPEVPEGTVVQEAQPGYVIGDRLLRPAMVGVSKGGPKRARQAPANDEGGDAGTGDESGGPASREDGERPGGRGAHVDTEA